MRSRNMMDDDLEVRGVEKVASRRLPEGGGSFLVLERMRCRILFRDGTASDPYDLDCVHRRGVDSVAILLYDDTADGLRVGVRRALRPIPFFRAEMDLPLPDGRDHRLVWEAVAGSLEPEDRGEEGLRRRVVQEVWEEAGFRIRTGQIEGLGAGFFPSHGQSSEMVHLRAVRVREGDRAKGQGGGTGPSEIGYTEFFEAGRILKMCWEGEIEDPKVEVGVRRLLQRAGRWNGMTVVACDNPGRGG